MTDRQIIVDDCPYQGECSVSGCKRDDDGCFIRQLFEERYRAENQIVELNKKVKAKEQECDRLKKQACDLRPELKYIIDKICSKYNINSKYYHEKIVEIINNLDKLKQTLTEIKEIAEKFYYQELGNRDCMNCDDYCFDKIRQKISEVLE